MAMLLLFKSSFVKLVSCAISAGMTDMLLPLKSSLVNLVSCSIPGGMADMLLKLNSRLIGSSDALTTFIPLPVLKGMSPVGQPF